MRSFQYTIKDPLGLHARPAGILVREAAKYQAAATIQYGDKTGNLKAIFAVMSLSVKHGSVVTLSFEGADEELACAAVRGFMEENL
jgi:phosphocarrier protein